VIHNGIDTGQYQPGHGTDVLEAGPAPPAQLGLATILQAYTGASDDEALEACVMDRRWQLVLNCMDHTQAPFSKTTLVGFRARLIATAWTGGWWSAR
jgi:hypothetical protein